MSYLRRAKTSCGRYVPKPNERDDNPNYEDETSIPLQDQIDNLRAKISLKEKYNKALREEVSETNQGAATMIAELTRQNKQLREDLESEKNAEKAAVKKALRSYRLFQLAVAEKDAESVINWLDDKIFDASKTLNEGMYLLRKMQNKLQEAEAQVRYLEKFPVPGTEGWEQRSDEDRMALECSIQNAKANHDACLILNKKYREILYYLKCERGKWPHIMQSMEKSLAQLKNELNSLEVMLEDALRFRDEAREKLQVIEEEASANRKQRRMQMSKMKKSVEKALQANTMKYATNAPATNPATSVRQVGPASSTKSMMTTESTSLVNSYQDIKQKQAQVQEFENRANKIVQAMCVRDLRFCPQRLLTVRKVGEMLTEELNMKAETKELLLKHKYRMELLLQFFRYTGRQQVEEFNAEILDRERLLREADAEGKTKTKLTSEVGTILSDLRLAMIGIDELFIQGKRKPKNRAHNQDMSQLMSKLLDKVKELVEAVNNLKSQFPDDSKPQRSYIGYVKFCTPPRYCRVGAPEEQEGEEESDQEPPDEINSKIPSREELKAKSERIRSQGMLRKGIR